MPLLCNLCSNSWVRETFNTEHRLDAIRTKYRTRFLLLVLSSFHSNSFFYSMSYDVMSCLYEDICTQTYTFLKFGMLFNLLEEVLLWYNLCADASSSHYKASLLVNYCPFDSALSRNEYHSKTWYIQRNNN